MRVTIALACFLGLGFWGSRAAPPVRHTPRWQLSASQGGHDPKSLKAAVQAYLGKRLLVTGTRPAIVLCDSAMVKALDLKFRRTVLMPFSRSIDDFRGCNPPSGPRHNAGIVLYIGSMALEGNVATVRATAESTALLWGEVATVVFGSGMPYAKSISFGDWVQD